MNMPEISSLSRSSSATIDGALVLKPDPMAEPIAESIGLVKDEEWVLIIPCVWPGTILSNKWLDI